MSIIDKFSSFYTDLASMQVSELASIYSEDVKFVDPIASHQGLSAVEAYFSRLLHNAKYCTFTIHNKEKTESGLYVVDWTMSFTSKRMNSGQPISVDGITMLKVIGNKITFHRDYYDLGQMIYENVPLLGRVIKRIKRSAG
ncbi:MAG: nuclear transport factor 2 family protein [Glaciecola sp.]